MVLLYEGRRGVWKDIGEIPRSKVQLYVIFLEEFGDIQKWGDIKDVIVTPVGVETVIMDTEV